MVAIRALDGTFTKGTIPYDRTGIRHTAETREKLRVRRQGETPRRPVEMLGKRFGRLEVVSFVDGSKPFK